MVKAVRELVKYRELLYMVVYRDIRIKYKQSIMGFLWAIFMPAIIISAGILVKFAMATIAGKPLEFSQISTISVKALPWSFFVASVRFSTNSLVSNANLVTKIYFPKEIFPFASVLSNLFDFMIAAGVLTIFLSFTKIGVSEHLLFVPIYIMLLIILTASIGTFLSCANLFFRDIKYIVEVIITFGIFFTPVFYEVEMFEKWSTLLLINPVAPILEGLNDSIVKQRMPQFEWLIYSATIAVIGFMVSYMFFKKMEPSFAERI
jgi:lipopolysaccharide transport system permease protein